jgi:hypothetical protein
MSLSPSHPLYLALEEPATRTREDANIMDGPADSKLQRKWTTQTVSLTYLNLKVHSDDIL